MTPEEEVKDECLRAHGRAKDALILVNRSGMATFYRKDGKPYYVHYGLTAAGSSDLIIPKRELITVEMVGTHIARFCVAELKAPGARTEKRREIKQGNFIDQIISLGGYGGIARSALDLERIVWPERFR